MPAPDFVHGRFQNPNKQRKKLDFTNVSSRMDFRQCAMKLFAIVIAGVLALMPGIGQVQAKVSIFIEVCTGYGVRSLPGRLCCRAVGERHHWRGYRNIRVVDCRGSVYRYTARMAGCPWRLDMSSRTGRIIGAQRIRC